MPKKRPAESTQLEKSIEIQKKINENLVELQKVHIALADKFDRLTKQITNLLSLFELAARSFAEQPSAITTEKDKDFLDKIDRLLEQNKTIAKGLTLMEERMKERIYGPPATRPAQKAPEEEEETRPPAGSRPLPRM